MKTAVAASKQPNTASNGKNHKQGDGNDCSFSAVGNHRSRHAYLEVFWTLVQLVLAKNMLCMLHVVLHLL